VCVEVQLLLLNLSLSLYSLLLNLFLDQLGMHLIMLGDKFFLPHYFNLLSVQKDEASFKCPVELSLGIGLMKEGVYVDNTPLRTLLRVVEFRR